MNTDLRVALLGHLRAWRGDAELDLGAPQQRAVLAYLLLREGEAASIDEIADALWGERAPGSARSVVRTYVSRLRRAVSSAEDDDEVIRSSGGGYAIAPGTVYLDWDAFRDQVRDAQARRAQGDPAEAAELLRGALRLWRGTPLGGARGEYVDQERSRLVQQRLAALEERLALELELGRHVEVGEDLAAAVAVEPMRERLRELQMLALYRSGRQAEALSVYDDVRRLLATELGIDPGTGLRELHQSILRADPALCPAARPAAAARPPAQLPAVPPGFVGRKEELDRIQDALRPAEGSPVLVVMGLGGMGKTALAVKAAYSMRDRFPDGQVYADLGTSSGQPAAPDAVLGSFLRSFGVPANRLPTCLEELAALWRTVLADRRVLILLDDASAAEEVQHLLPAAPGCAAIVTTWRHMIDLPGAQWLRLEALSPAEALEMLAGLVGPERLLGERDTAVELVELCSYQPQAVRVAAYLLQTRPHLTLRQVHQRLEALLHRPTEAEDGIAHLHAPLLLAESRLDAEQRTAFRLAALPDWDELTPELAAALLGVPRSRARRILESLVDAHLLRAGPEGTYRYYELVKAFARWQAWEQEGVERCDAALTRLLRFHVRRPVASSHV